ncbi:MAG: hypothetical protein HQL51_11720 [Magnetococcales bacterium]|nr:hypothetical protein [Magnetococcales bacterium]
MISEPDSEDYTDSPIPSSGDYESHVESATKSDDSIHAVRYSVQGPVPSAYFIKHWEEILPGSADRILRMSEKALDTQISAVEFEMRSRKTSQWLFFMTRTIGQLVGLTAIVGVLYLAFDAQTKGAHTEAAWMVVVGMVALVGLVVTGRWKSTPSANQKSPSEASSQEGDP